MRLFKVIDEQDGATTKENGKTSTEIIRLESYYAAESIEDVWQHIAWIRNDPERTLIMVAESAPLITVIEPARKP